ncbi:hypothetical protein [Nakamurella sp.]|uniref:hypothetical protein n=1 Tax=Nakamurella sp. TaxID=1869182 RepID=UPI003B3A1DBE
MTLRIERLVIDGVSMRSAERLAAAFLDELRRLVEAGIAPGGVADPVVDAEESPDAAGRLVAAAVFSRLNPSQWDGCGDG